MDRRNFFGSVVGAALLPLVTDKLPLPPREFHRYCRATDRWIKVAPQEVRVGDQVWIHDPPDGYSEVILVSRNEPDEGCLYSTYRIDPKTNEWVSEG